MPGRVIVLEGLDGWDRSRQLEETSKSLTRGLVPNRTVILPVYKSDCGKLLVSHISGSLFWEENTGAYAAGSAYALDRFISYNTDWRKDYEDGKVLVFSRYTPHEMLTQAARLETPEEQDDFIAWLYRYEHINMGIPMPNLVIYLDICPQATNKVILQRYCGDPTMRDLYAHDLEMQNRCRDIAARLIPRYGWVAIDCCDDYGEILSVDKIQAKINDVLLNHGVLPTHKRFEATE